MNCTICESEDTTLMEEYGLKWYMCHSCGADPIPDTEAPELLPRNQDAETMANARLIAAAPEMFDMLKSMCKMKCRDGGIGIGHDNCGVLPNACSCRNLINHIEATS